MVPNSLAVVGPLLVGARLLNGRELQGDRSDRECHAGELIGIGIDRRDGEGGSGCGRGGGRKGKRQLADAAAG